MRFLPTSSDSWVVAWNWKFTSLNHLRHRLSQRLGRSSGAPRWWIWQISAHPPSDDKSRSAPAAEKRCWISLRRSFILESAFKIISRRRCCVRSMKARNQLRGERFSWPPSDEAIPSSTCAWKCEFPLNPYRSAIRSSATSAGLKST